MKINIYALYKGDEYLIEGTKKDLADYLKITINNLDSRISKSKKGIIPYEYGLFIVMVDKVEKDEYRKND